MENQSEIIQGYIPAIYNNGQKKFVAFKGGFTTDFKDAFCEPEEKALAIAKKYATGENDFAKVLPVNGLCEIMEKVKTKKAWSESRLDLSTFLNEGDAVDEDMQDYFTGVLPPATWTNKAIQIGEPYDFNAQGKSVYATIESIEGQWIYTGHKTRAEVR